MDNSRKKNVTYALALASILLILLLPLIASAQQGMPKDVADSEANKKASETADATKRAFEENLKGFKEADRPIQLMLGMYINNSNEPEVYIKLGSRPEFRNFVRVMLELFIPFYAMMIIISGTYIVWSGYSHVARARAKNMVLRLIVGMVLCGLSIPIYDLVIDFNNFLVTSIITGGGLPLTWGPMDNMPGLDSMNLFSTLFVTVTFGLGLCIVLPTWCGLIALWMMPYIVLSLRNMLVISLGILFPLTIFLLSFRFTKGLGAYLLKMTLTWIFMPVPMAIFAVLSYRIGLLATPGSFLIPFTAFICWVMVSGAPMYMTSLLGVAGAAFIQAGRTMVDTRMVYLGYMLYQRDPSAITQAAYHGQLMKGLGQTPHMVAMDWKGRAEGGKDSPPLPAPFERRLDRVGGGAGQGGGSYLPAGWAKLDTKGVFDKDLGYTWGASLKERAERLVFGRDENLSNMTPEDQAKYKSPWAKHRDGFEGAWKDWSAGRRSMIGAVGLSVYHGASAVVGRQVVLPVVTGVGKVAAGLTKNMFDSWGVGASLLNVSKKMTGYYEIAKDKSGNDTWVYRHGMYSVGAIGSEIKKSWEDSTKAYDKKAEKGVPPGTMAGLKVAAGVFAGLGLFIPATAPAAAAVLLGTGVGADVARYFMGRAKKPSSGGPAGGSSAGGSTAAAPGGGGGSGGGPSPSPPAGPAPSAPSTPSPSPPAGPTTTPSTTTPPTPSTPSAGPGPSGPAAPSAPVSAAPVHPSGGQPTGAQAAPAPSPAQPSGEAAGQTGGAGFWARAKRAGAQFGRNNVNPWNLALGASILTGQGGLALGISAAMGATKVVKGIRESRRAREQKEELPKSTRKVKGYLNDLFGTEARTKGESFSGVEYRSGKFMIGNEQVTRDRIDAAHRTVDAAAMGGTIGYADKVLGAASKVGGEEYGGVSADAGKLRTGDSGVSRKDLKKAAKTVRKDKTGAVTPEERAQIKKADKARREPSEISNYEYARISSGREMLKKELQGDPSLRQAFEPGGVPEAQPPAPSPAESPGERRQAGGQMGFDFMKGESEGTESREAPGEGAAATQAAAREGGEKAGSKRPDDRGPGPQVGRAQNEEEKVAEVRREEEAPHQGDEEMTDAEKEEQEKAKPRRKDRGGGESGG